jgi:hypothetical protein
MNLLHDLALPGGWRISITTCGLSRKGPAHVTKKLVLTLDGSIAELGQTVA